MSCLGHILQGIVSGILVFFFPAVAGIWAGLFVAYQGLSFARKRDWTGKGDTAGLDTMDFLVGFVLGVIPGMVLCKLVRCVDCPLFG